MKYDENLFWMVFWTIYCTANGQHFRHYCTVEDILGSIFDLIIFYIVLLKIWTSDCIANVVVLAFKSTNIRKPIVKFSLCLMIWILINWYNKKNCIIRIWFWKPIIYIILFTPKRSQKGGMQYMYLYSLRIGTKGFVFDTKE